MSKEIPPAPTEQAPKIREKQLALAGLAAEDFLQSMLDLQIAKTDKNGRSYSEALGILVARTIIATGQKIEERHDG